MVRVPLVVVACLVSSSAGAARVPDLVTTIDAPTGVFVYESATYEVTVANDGQRHASGVTLTIDLPQTNNQPTQYVMGELGSMDARCAPSGLQLVCSLGRIRRGRSSTIWFDIALPESTDDLFVDAFAETTTPGETNLADNDHTVIADLRNYEVSFTSPVGLTIEHCTGTDLTSFFECVCAPSSITSHTTTLESDGSITFPYPGYTGQWWTNGPEHLAFEYSDSGSNVVLEFEGFGVSNDCWEGVATFPGNPTYVSPYSVCR